MSLALAGVHCEHMRVCLFTCICLLAWTNRLAVLHEYPRLKVYCQTATECNKSLAQKRQK